MSQVAIASYLRTAGGTLVPVEDWHGGVEDTDYIEGAVVLSIDGHSIIDEQMWDYVDQIWAYIINMLEKLHKSEHAWTYFPDQPIALTFERVRANRLFVSLQVNPSEVYSAQVDEAQFTKAVLNAGVHFFGEMLRILPDQSQDYSRELERVEKLRARTPRNG